MLDNFNGPSRHEFFFGDFIDGDQADRFVVVTAAMTYRARMDDAGGRQTVGGNQLVTPDGAVSRAIDNYYRAFQSGLACSAATPDIVGDFVVDVVVNDGSLDGCSDSVDVAEGQTVSAGDSLLVLEAMKMEFTIEADIDGVVESLHCTAGDQVASRQLLVAIQSAEQG